MIKIIINIFTIIWIIATVIWVLFAIMFWLNNNELVAKQLDILESVENETPEKIKEIILNNQHSGKEVSIYSTGSTKVMSINYWDKKEKIDFFISIINNSDVIFWGIWYWQYLNVVFPQQNLVIDWVDLKKWEYIKKIDFKVEDWWSISDRVYFSLDRVWLNYDWTYPSNIKLYLTYNDWELLDNDYEIILLRSNISIINSSWKERMSTDYYNIFKNQYLWHFWIQRVNNRIEETFDYAYVDTFTNNQIWFTEERYKELAEYINYELFNGSFELKKISVDECNSNIIDNRIELLKKEENWKYLPVEYMFDWWILPSDYSLCKVSNIIINLIK